VTDAYHSCLLPVSGSQEFNTSKRKVTPFLLNKLKIALKLFSLIIKLDMSKCSLSKKDKKFSKNAKKKTEIQSPILPKKTKLT